MPLFKAEKLNIIPRKLHEKFIVPPFSVINTRQPYFRDRLRYWQNLGLRNSSGRIEGLAYDNRRMTKYDELHRKSEKPEEIMTLNGTSMFNPVICEILYTWFTIPHSKILDPFAGGIVRGAMASLLGHSYVGYDISKDQVQANKMDYEDLKNRINFEDNTVWVNKSSEYIDLCDSEFDMVLTCPPYYNLEKYTNDPKDLSNQATYQQFLSLYEDILIKTYTKLKTDSFFVIVVSEFRGGTSDTGFCGFVSDTIDILKNKCKMCYYNEIIIYNDTSNLAITSGNYMNKVRKVGRQHQNILVFFKGDTSHIKDKFGPLVEDK